ncbi:MAG TPA: hypothetical protein VIM11_18330 [Tepidisphaeraceae bacterium]|jgi:hypothetical protein
MTDDTRAFTVGALALVKQLLIHGANVNRIRSALYKSEGVWFKDVAIGAAARQFGVTLATVAPTGQPKTEAGAAQMEQMLISSLRPKREPDKVRLVPPKSFPVPAGGYRIGMGSQ